MLVTTAYRVRTSRFLRFAVVGAIAAAVNIGARALFSFVAPFEIAVLLAFPLGLTTGYLLTKLFVFSPSGQSMRTEYLRFALVNLVALVQVWLLSVGLAKWFFPFVGFSFHAELIAHAIAVLSPAITSYWAHKLFTFRVAKI